MNSSYTPHWLVHSDYSNSEGNSDCFACLQQSVKQQKPDQLTNYECKPQMIQTTFITTYSLLLIIDVSLATIYFYLENKAQN